MSSIARLLVRKYVENMFKKFGSEGGGEVITNSALKYSRIFEVEEISKKFSDEFLRETKKRTGKRRASPWILPPIWEDGEMVFRSYTPCKGEIMSLISEPVGKAEVEVEVNWGVGRVFKSYSPCKGELLSFYSLVESVLEPEHVLVRICKYYRRRLSSLYRRVVGCNYSEAAVPLVSVPWLMLPIDRGVYGLYSPSHSPNPSHSPWLWGGNCFSKLEGEFMHHPRAKLVGSSHGWVASFNEEEEEEEFFLSNPLSGHRIKLPSPGLEKPPSKVIMSCSPDDGEEECLAMMSCGFGGLRRLAFCRPGRDKEWTPIGSLYKEHHGFKCVRNYDDFVYSATRKRFFCVVEDENTVECWDLRDPHNPRLDWTATGDGDDLDLDLDLDLDSELTEKDWCRRIRYLAFAEHSNQLFMLTRYFMDAEEEGTTKTIDFEVDRVDQGELLRIKDHSLDGLVMFVGTNHSLAMPASASASASGLLKPDSIYFMEHDHIGIFDYKTKACSMFQWHCTGTIMVYKSLWELR